MDTRIIILNGPSCAGKSTICREICKQSNDTFIHLQADDVKTLFLTIFQNVEKKDNHSIGRKIFTKLLCAIAREVVKSGSKVVIDTNIDGSTAKELAQLYLEYLQEFKIYFVGIDCPLEERLRRFQNDPNKGRRNEQNIRFQSDVFEVNKDLYDVTFDTSWLDGKQIATEIIKNIGFEVV